MQIILPPCDSEIFEKESVQYEKPDIYLNVEGFRPSSPTGSDHDGDDGESGVSSLVNSASGENSDATADGFFPVKATLCLSSCVPSPQQIKATVILTTGVNQIVAKENKLIDVETTCSKFKAMANGKKWYMKAFTLKDSQNVRERLMIKWNEMLKEQGSLNAIEPHVLFSSGADGRLVYMRHKPVCKDTTQKVQFIGLSTSLEKGYSHIDVYSHLRREKALHDFRMKDDDDYLSFWQQPVKPNQEKFLDTFYPKNNPGVLQKFRDKMEPVSFFLPTIQVGFYTGERKHIGNKEKKKEPIKVIYFQNSYDDKDYHHKFPNSNAVECPPNEELLNGFNTYLAKNWEDIAKNSHGRREPQQRSRQHKLPLPTNLPLDQNQRGLIAPAGRTSSQIVASYQTENNGPRGRGAVWPKR